MKIKKLQISNYKQFKSLELDLTYPKGHKKEGKPLDKICLIGQSGTGKTNILEIIKKSVIDFSNEKEYKPFNEFSEKENLDKLITNKYLTSNNLEIETLFTPDNSEIFGDNTDDFLEEKEKIYYVGTKTYISKTNNDELYESNEVDTLEMSHEDKKLLNELYNLKTQVRIESIKKDNYYLDPKLSFINTLSKYSNIKGMGKKKKLREIDYEINSILDRYPSKKSLSNKVKEIKTDNWLNRSIVEVNEENDVVWETIKHKIDMYESNRTSYVMSLSNKLLDESTYSKEDYQNDLSTWENENENIINKIANEINSILIKFNLQLIKLDEDKDNYNSFTIKDLSTDLVIEYDKLSTGTKNLLSTFIPLKAFSPKDSIILIDEPEMSFYPDIQTQLVDLYSNVGIDNQLILATHSPQIASYFEPWEIVELKFDSSNNIYRELYYENENKVDNYILDPRMLTWTSILTNIFDLEENSNFTFREQKLMEYAQLKALLKTIKDENEKKEKVFRIEKTIKTFRFI